MEKKYLNEWQRAVDFLDASRRNFKEGDLRLQADYGKASEIVEFNEKIISEYLSKIEKVFEKLRKRYKL